MSKAQEYRVQTRAGKGSRNLKVSDKTGCVKEIITIDESQKENYDIVILSKNGQSIRINLESLKTTGRNTQGVRVINLGETDQVNAIEVIEKVQMEDIDNE